MKFLKRKWYIIFLILGIGLFIGFIYKFWTEAINIIKYNINFYYLSIFVFVTILSIVPHVMRFKIILNSYGHKVNLFRLIKQHICAFSISYITPVSRLGGEPIRILMLKKECNIDYKTGTTVMILDKFVEILGSALYGIIGLILLIVFVGISIYFKFIFGFLIFLALFLLFLIYYRIIKKKGVFSNLFLFLKLNKIKKLRNLTKTLKDIELKMYDFFKYKKKIFLLSFIFYLITGIFFIIQFKFLLLSIGINSSIFQLILIINVWGLMNFVPTPASIGFLEAGQFSLFQIMRGDGASGLAMTLILRVYYLLVVCIGFIFIVLFSGKQLLKKSK